MAKVAVNGPCACGSGRKYKKCCRVFHGGRPAPPQRLMPARYCAYAVGDVDFLVATTHPDGPLWQPDQAAWRTELAAYCRATEFVGLEVHTVRPPAEELGEAEDAFVSFTAHLEQGGDRTTLRECSRFRRHGARWKYFDGDVE